MSEPAYYLRSRGQDSGPFTVDQIRQMWDTEQITGAYQVNTATGCLLVQDFLAQAEEATAIELLRQEQEAAARAEVEKLRLEQVHASNEQLRRRQAEEERHRREEEEKVALENAKQSTKL